MQRISLWIAVGFLIPMSLFFVNWGDSENPQLKKGVRVVRYLSSKRQLKRSSFMALEDKSPSQFVEWMFSPLGLAEWPPMEDSLEFSPEELKMIKKIGIPAIPKDVAIVASSPTSEKGKQIVVKADDSNQTLIVEGFISAQSPSVFREEISFPTF